jgi:hypothetical protein
MTPQAQGLRGLTRRLPPGPADLRRTAGIENAVRRLLLGGVMPLWIGAGLGKRPPTAGTRRPDAWLSSRGDAAATGSVNPDHAGPSGG